MGKILSVPENEQCYREECETRTFRRGLCEDHYSQPTDMRDCDEYEHFGLVLPDKEGKVRCTNCAEELFP